MWLTLLETDTPFEFVETSISAGEKCVSGRASSRPARLVRRAPPNLTHDPPRRPAWFTAAYKRALGADLASDGKVPVLEEPLADGSTFSLTESAVVADYVAARAGGALLPATPLERARTTLFVEQTLGRYIPAFYGLLRAQTPEAVEAARAAFHAAVGAVGVALGAGPFFLGARVTMADVLLYPFVERLCVLKHYRQLELPTEGAGFAAFEAWTVAMAARPSAVATAQPADFFINGYRFYAEPPKAA